MDSLVLFEALGVDHPVVVDIDVCFKRSVRHRLPYPSTKSWGDIDNIQKGLLDCLVRTGHLSDDSLVVGGEVFKFFSEEDFISIRIFDIEV